MAGHSYGFRLTTPAEAMGFRSLGADVINHSLAIEATLACEIGDRFVPVAYVTAGMNNYLDRSSGPLLQQDVLSGLQALTSRVALEMIAALQPTCPCGCHNQLTA